MNKSIKIFVLLFTVFLALVASFSFVSLLGKESHFVVVFQIIEIVLFLLFWLLVYLVIRKFLMISYRETYQRDIPSLFLSFLRLFFIIFAILSIVVFVFQKSIFSIAALAGLVGAGITFAIGELINDVFSGVILEFEGPLDVGDWIKVGEEKEGVVTEIRWRTIVLRTLDETLVIIPHRDLSKGYTNFSKPDKNSWAMIEVTMDHGVPIERMKRIFGAALKRAPLVHKHDCDVFAFDITAKGVTYQLHYMLSEHLLWREIRSDVVTSVMTMLDSYGLRVSQNLGEYAIYTGEKPPAKVAPLPVSELINKVKFLNHLPPETLDQISKAAVQHSYHPGEKIVSQGDEGKSLFIISEGYVEVSIRYMNELGEEKKNKLFDLGYPESFGEMALLLNDPRSADVIALVDTLVHEISQDVLKEALSGQPELYEKLVQDAQEKKSRNELKRTELARMHEEEVVHQSGVIAQLKELFS